MAELWKGAPVAAALTERLCGQAERLRARGISPTLAIVRVGERSEDLSYERGACKRCEMIGISVKHFILPVNCTQEELLTVIRRINEDGAIHGCLLFRPLPRHLDEAAVCAALSPVKDVDGITSGSLASVFSGDGQGYPPCTAQACLELLDYYGFEPTGRRAVVVGRSLVIGRPAAMLLLNRNATVTLCHRADLAAECRQELLIAAAAKAGLSLLPPPPVVVDVGSMWTPPAVVATWISLSRLVGAVTPVPGGVGAVTTSVLARHVLDAAAKSADISL
ncbi:MAG: bifunctional 5,10-methylenetetrahydrofolate dehydrogenase/5,10-methenyltetrahydrofolate cyclohydrolase [Flavonifractor plautii]